VDHHSDHHPVLLLRQRQWQQHLGRQRLRLWRLRRKQLRLLKEKSKKWVQISVCTHFLCRLTGIVK
jgi:hypothetical protein